MNGFIKRSFVAIPLLIILALAAYGAKGWGDARAEAPALRARAQPLIAQGLGPEALGKEKLDLLLKVEDPTFYQNNGTDFSTPGASRTSLTQSLSKRLAFARFKPGLRKIRQTGYAIGLTSKLTKGEILTLFFAETSFKGSDRKWTKGFDAASRRFFNTPIADLDTVRFTVLVAAGIAPAELAPDAPNDKLKQRVERIQKLVAGSCQPKNWDDAALEGCA